MEVANTLAYNDSATITAIKMYSNGPVWEANLESFGFSSIFQHSTSELQWVSDRK
jgi:hypothetical protein